MFPSLVNINSEQSILINKQCVKLEYCNIRTCGYLQNSNIYI